MGRVFWTLGSYNRELTKSSRRRFDLSESAIFTIEMIEVSESDISLFTIYEVK